MKILVTGASGFIGGYVAMEFAKIQGNQVVATGRSATDRFKDFQNIEYKKLDLTGDLPELPFDVCIHSAGLADDKSTKQQLEQANVLATANLIRALKNCKCFILISSASVYDFADGKPKSEADASLTSNISDYGRSKLIGEEAMRQSGIPSVYIFRPRAVYGPGDRVLMPRILKLVGKRKTFLPGPVNSISSLTHVRNLFQAIKSSIAVTKPGIHTYNITDKEAYRLKDIFAEISFIKYGHRNFSHAPMSVVNLILAITKLLRIKSVLTRQSVNYLNQDSVLRIQKATQELGYSPELNFFNSKDSLDL
jgi:nucleoside-diphosphate-sugar epimerase